MTAEEKLKELYKQQEVLSPHGSAFLAADHIDLIVNLVVERLSNESLYRG